MNAGESTLVMDGEATSVLDYVTASRARARAPIGSRRLA